MRPRHEVEGRRDIQRGQFTSPTAEHKRTRGVKRKKTAGLASEAVSAGRRRCVTRVTEYFKAERMTCSSCAGTLQRSLGVERELMMSACSRGQIPFTTYNKRDTSPIQRQGCHHVSRDAEVFHSEHSLRFSAVPADDVDGAFCFWKLKPVKARESETNRPFYAV